MVRKLVTKTAAALPMDAIERAIAHAGRDDSRYWAPTAKGEVLQGRLTERGHEAKRGKYPAHEFLSIDSTDQGEKRVRINKVLATAIERLAQDKTFPALKKGVGVVVIYQGEGGKSGDGKTSTRKKSWSSYHKWGIATYNL